MKLLLLFPLLLAGSAAAELIPAARLTTWTPGTYTGVIGGIPTTRTIYDDADVDGITDSLESIDATGATNVATAIQSALSAATSGTVVRLPAGTFRIDSQLTAGVSDTGVTLRGAGMASTIINSHVSSAFYIGSNDTVGLPFGASLSDVTISSGLSAGSETVTIGTTAGFTAGQIMYITVANDTALPVVSVYNYDEVQGQIVKLVSKTSTTLTFWPPLYEAYGAGARTARVYGPSNSFYIHSFGMEDLTVDCGNFYTDIGTFTVDASTNVITTSGAHGLSVGHRVRFRSATALPGGLSLDTYYYVLTVPSSTTLTVSATSGGAVVDITDTGSGTHTASIGNAYAGIEFINARDCWMKNVKVRDHKNYGLSLFTSNNFEMRHSTIEPSLNGGATSGSGILVNKTSASLFEDNIITENFPSVEQNQGASGNVFAFNYLDGMLDTNHTPHNNYTLVEGNTGPGAYVMSDGYFGSEANLTIARNYISTIQLRRFTRNANTVGNIMAGEISTGLPFIGNTSSSGTAQLSMSDPWRDWQMTATLTTRTSDSGGVITLDSGALFTGGQVIRLVWASGASSRFANVTAVSGNDVTITDYNGGTALPADETPDISIGPGSFYSGDAATSSYPEIDLDVAATLIDKGNYRTDNSSLSSLGGDTVPDSFFRSSKPSYFGTLGWPAYSSASPGDAGYADIPAGYRVANAGSDPPAEDSGTTITTGTLRIGAP